MASETNRKAEDRGYKAALRDRVYLVPVCAICASDAIVSTQDDSWCEECHEWMSAETITVGVLASDPVADAARTAALSQEDA